MVFRHTKSVSSALFMGSMILGACALPDDTERTKNVLKKYGTLEAEWQVRDEANKKTHTYVLLRNQRNSFETYEIVATDNQRRVTREMVGGIDGTGCFLLEAGKTTPWILQKPPETLEDAMPSGDKTRTACLEYKDTGAWQFIPEKDRKAAEPPPPEPKPAAPAPDAGTPDAGTSGGVESALP